MRDLDQERNQLEEKIREQNLIHELVMINELLLMEQNKLRKQVDRIPRLEQKILDLVKESEQQRGDQEDRLALSRQEGTLQNQRKLPFPQYHKAVRDLREEKRFLGESDKKTFSASKPPF